MDMRIFLLTFCALILGLPAHADTPFSQYGVIQNVQNYSSNPFWSPNAPYNQRMPSAVYATGPDVETADCQQIVASLVTTQCAMRNNCIDSQLSDIRPAIMLQLSRIPDGNYATACAGYIDTAFDNYVKMHGHAAPSGVVDFPYATAPNPTADAPDYEIENPYEIELMDWQSDILERKLELQNLQSMNGAGGDGVERAAFPSTYADLSFEERIENAAAGYQPYAGKSAYRTMKIESAEDAAIRAQRLAGKNNNGSSTTNNRTKIILSYWVHN